jgi:hypothetical protein
MLARSESPAPGGNSMNESNIKLVIRVITWLLLAFTSLMLGFRMLTRFFIRGGSMFTLEDALIITSFVSNSLLG